MKHPRRQRDEGSLPIAMVVVVFVMASTITLLSMLNLQLSKYRAEQDDIYRSTALESGVAYASQKMFSSQNAANADTAFPTTFTVWRVSPDGKGVFRVKQIRRYTSAGVSEIAGFVVESLGGDPEYNCKRLPTGRYDCTASNLIPDAVTYLYSYNPLKTYGRKKLTSDTSSQSPWTVTARFPYDYTRQFPDGIIAVGSE